MSEAEPLGRQPKPVRVTLTGEPEDVIAWTSRLMRAAAYKGDMVELKHANIFIIYPNAVND